MERKKLIILPQLNDQNGDIEKKWFVYFSWRNPKTGKMERVRMHKGLHKIKDQKARYQEANKIISEYTEKLKAGWTPLLQDDVIYSDDLRYHNVAKMFGRKKAGNKTFNYFANEYIDKKTIGLQEETVSTYRSRLRIFDMWLQKKGYSDYEISVINNSVIMEFFAFLIREEQLSANTTNKYKWLLNSVFDLAIDRNSLQVNPVHSVPQNRNVSDKTPRPIQDHDIEEFKNELMKDPQLWLTVQLEFYCFLRPGKEIRLLQIKHFDFVRGSITVPKTLAKTNRDKVVIIPAHFLNVLRNEYQFHKYDREFFIIGKNGKPGPTPLGKNNMRFRFVKIRKKLNMPEAYKLYSWKHTGNVRAAEADIPLYDRQQQNGHQSSRTTEIYTKNKMGHDSRAIREAFPKL